MMTTISSLLRTTLCLLALCSIGCAGIGFEKAWQESVAAHQAGTGGKDPVAGPWKGTWETATNGHKGKLRCIATPGPEAGAYDFRYHATYFKVLSGAYKVNFDVEPTTDGGYAVEGSQGLGPFGSFDHDGKIKGQRFDATYSNRSGSQQGAFEMQRPQ